MAEAAVVQPVNLTWSHVQGTSMLSSTFRSRWSTTEYEGSLVVLEYNLLGHRLRVQVFE